MVLNPSLISTIASAAAVAGVIAFHEAGHFFAAKWQGMKVQSYNIGYGPKIVSFNDSSDTEFALRLLPLGTLHHIDCCMI
jgi:membrane-associated protease RseP (regulator of RpoE activity)